MSILKKISQECLAVRIRTLNRLITSVYDEELRSVGLRVSQLNLLVAIGTQEEISAKKICEILSLDESTMSRDLGLLLKNGWVSTKPSKSDKRAKILKLTSSGQKKVSAAESGWNRAQLRAQERLSKDSTDAIQSIVNTLWGFPKATA